MPRKFFTTSDRTLDIETLNSLFGVSADYVDSSKSVKACKTNGATDINERIGQAKDIALDIDSPLCEPLESLAHTNCKLDTLDHWSIYSFRRVGNSEIEPHLRSGAKHTHTDCSWPNIIVIGWN